MESATVKRSPQGAVVSRHVQAAKVSTPTPLCLQGDECRVPLGATPSV